MQLHLKNFSLSFSGKKIFNDTSFLLEEGNKICLVGRNGSGKTTLLKIMSGSIDIEEGNIYYQKNLNISYLDQEFESNLDITIIDYLQNDKKIIQLPEYERLYRIDNMLDQLSINKTKLMNKLSGGKIKKVMLAKALLSNPDVLLLDEPTNHLDIKSIIWLENYLKDFKGSLVLISHDQMLLNSITNRVAFIDSGKIHIIKSGFVNYQQAKDEIYNQQLNNFINLEKKLKKEKDWLNKGVTARRKRDQRRLGNIDILKSQKHELHKIIKEKDSTIEVDLSSKVHSSKIVLKVDSINHSYNDVSPPKIMFSNVSFEVYKGDVFGFVGGNGAGKSTLINLILSKIIPNSGTIKFAKNIDISYFDQQRKDLDDEISVLEYISPNKSSFLVKESGSMISVTEYLRKFLFKDEQLHGKIKLFSGGEKNRLILAKIFLNPGNFIILDEPTNDLDFEAIESLQSIINEYKGTVIIVSHNRSFLKKIVNRFIFFENNKCYTFNEPYSDHLISKFSNQNKKNITKSSKNIKTRKKNCNINGLSYIEQRDFDLIPDEIANLDAQITNLNKKIQNIDLDQVEGIDMKIHLQEIQKLDLKRNELEIKWLELLDKKESFNK